MLSIYFSIAVVILVAAAFFGVCWVAVCGLPRKRRTGAVHRKTAASAHRHHAPAREEQPEAAESRPAEETPAAAPAAAVNEATQVFNFGGAGGEEDNERTRVFSSTEELRPAAEHREKETAPRGFVLEPEPEVMESPQPPEILEEYFVRHFLNQYGAVSRTAAQDTRTVTHRLVERARSLAGKDASDVLTHIMVQEALQNAQRTYVMLPNETVLGMVEDAFYDVAWGSRTDTRTILAYDALRVMPRMEMGQFHALSLLLLFYYSRNMDNVDAEALRAYADRYVEPLLRELPHEYSGYQQLEYLHCVSLENKDTAFGQVLRDSYPLIFAFRGCMKSELESIRSEWPAGSVVSSLFNSYYKAAVIDDAVLPEYFEKYHIDSAKEQTLLNALLHSRPVAYDRREMEHVLSRVAPPLAELQKVWDGSLLRRSSLTLMGMYIAQVHIRELIGEEFDLSHWM